MPDELNQLTIENQTRSDIRYVFVSTDDSEGFGGNLVQAAGPLRNGQEIGLFVHYPDRCGLFNVLAVAEDAESFSVFHFEVCDEKPARLALLRNYFAGTKVVDPTTSVVIENGTSYPIKHLFLAASDSVAWGIDYLSGRGEISPGMAEHLQLMTPNDEVTYAVRAVDAEGRTYSFAIDVSGKPGEFVYEIDDDWVDTQ